VSVLAICSRETAELGRDRSRGVEGRKNGKKLLLVEYVWPCAACVRAREPLGHSHFAGMTGVLEVLAFPESFARMKCFQEQCAAGG